MADTEELLVRHKLDVDAYYKMATAGILGPGDRVELLNGEIIDKAPIGLDHATAVDWLNKGLVMACGDLAMVSTQNSVRLDRRNEPQPDFAVSRPRADWYRTQRPGPSDIMLLVEVSASSLRFDRAIKLPLYARAGVPEFWIVDVPRNVVIVHRRPEGDAYADVTTHGPGDTITLAAALDIKLSLAGLFG